MQQLQNYRHLLYRLGNPIMHILAPYILYKIKIVLSILVHYYEALISYIEKVQHEQNLSRHIFFLLHLAYSYEINKLLELNDNFIPSKIHKIITGGDEDNFSTSATCKLIQKNKKTCKLITDVVLHLYPHKLYGH